MTLYSEYRTWTDCLRVAHIQITSVVTPQNIVVPNALPEKLPMSIVWKQHMSYGWDQSHTPPLLLHSYPRPGQWLFRMALLERQQKLHWIRSNSSTGFIPVFPAFIFFKISPDRPDGSRESKITMISLSRSNTSYHRVAIACLDISRTNRKQQIV